MEHWWYHNNTGNRHFRSKTAWNDSFYSTDSK